MENTVKITAAEVNKLRKATGAGMMDCKKALVEAEGDFDKAIEVLRKKGQKVAAKRADRDSSEGAAVAKINADNTSGVAIVLGCETDFVGKNENFVKLAHDLAEAALNYNSKEEFLASEPLNSSIRYVIFGGEALNPFNLGRWKTSYPDCNRTIKS